MEILPASSKQTERKVVRNINVSSASAVVEYDVFLVCQNIVYHYGRFCTPNAKK